MSESLLLEPLSGLRYRRLGASTPSARVLLLHGVGGCEDNLEAVAAALDPRLEVLLLRAPLNLGAGSYAWFPVQFGANGPQPDLLQAERARVQLVSLLKNLPPLPTVMAGFSQGGIMSASVALTEPALLAGFGLLSGRILPELEPQLAAPQALATLHGFVAHGLHDDKLPFAWAERSRSWLSALGVRFAFHEYPMGHQLCAPEVQDFNQWLAEPLNLA